MKILFVDDEQRVLSGLKRMLRDMRNEWDMQFCLGADEAIAKVRQEPFDVVVSDMRMPHMDGAALLAEVKKIRPESIRIILSGESDASAIFRSMGVTHRYLDKPCDPEILKKTIDLARGSARELITDDTVARALTGIDRLPTIPEIYQKVVAELESPDSSAARVGELIEREVGMSAKLLQVVNSAAFRFPEPIERVSKAVALLGMERVKQLVLAVGLFEQFQGEADAAALAEVWRHSSRTFELAMQFAEALKGGAPGLLDTACTSAILHECGRLVLLSSLRGRYADALDRARREGVPLEQTEREEFGVEHGQIGAYVISLWGLPRSIVDVVAHHAKPSQSNQADVNLALAAVHAACALAHDPENENLDLDYLTRAGLDGRLAEWRAVAAKPAEEVR
jgi:HD-like signal output (HDOD) protein